MTDRLVSYDNEKDLSALVDDCMEFIVSETFPIVLESVFKSLSRLLYSSR